ncbi:MAG: GNAT family N-acetyltransferase [Burkholderiaceae bacterium]|nr:GNAT family N-acetyltransferase [Burkholderiaceae bacterium]
MDVILGGWDSQGPRATAIRLAVFVDEQGIPVSIELDNHDAQAVHALAIDTDGVVAGTGRLLPDAHIGRMAVLANYRGRGVGTQLLLALVAEARRRDYPGVVLSAQVHACPFYEAHGFVRVGEPFLEAGIPHVSMTLKF